MSQRVTDVNLIVFKIVTLAKSDYSFYQALVINTLHQICKFYIFLYMCVCLLDKDEYLTQ